MSLAGPSRLGPRIARLPHRSVLEVSGPDARKFLNGQSCKNIEALGGGYSGFLNASVRTCSSQECQILTHPRAEYYTHASSSNDRQLHISSVMNHQKPILRHYRPFCRHTNYVQKSVSRTYRKNGIHGHLGAVRWKKEA
jgi:hypothetical protein